MNKLLVKLDYIIVNNSWRIPWWIERKIGWGRYDFPTKRLVEHCFKNFSKGRIKYRHEQIAHMYAYDSTVSKEDLGLIHTCYGPLTKERIRQCLMKFVRLYYK